MAVYSRTCGTLRVRLRKRLGRRPSSIPWLLHCELAIFFLRFSVQEECLEKKFVVFPDEIDLRAHALQMHPDKAPPRRIQVTRRLPDVVIRDSLELQQCRRKDEDSNN